MSILHRVSGALMFLLLPFVIWLFDASVTSEISATHASPAPSSPASASAPAWFVKLVALALIWAYLHHLIAGVRHLWMDMTHSVSREQGRSSAMRDAGVERAADAGCWRKLFGLY